MSAVGRTLRWTAIALLALLLLAGALVLWVANTQRGTAWLANLVGRTLEDRLSFASIDGTLAGPVTLRNVRYRDPETGLHVSLERVMADVELLDALRRVVHVADAEVEGIDVALGKPQPEAVERESRPFSIEPPIDVVVERFVVADAQIGRANQTLLIVNRAELIGSWTAAGIAVEQLDVRSPQGEVHFTSRVSHDEQYVGDGRGRFRWRAGTLTYAGNVTADADGREAQIALRMSSPLDARLDASIGQVEALPWQFTLEVPRFDPRDSVMPETTMQSLSASLRGEGSLERGEVNGKVIVDDLPVHIDPLRFARAADRIILDPLLVRLGEGEGSLEARGELLTAQEPLGARLDMSWHDLQIPARLAGQELHSHGKLRFSGSTQSFVSGGEFAIGPPNELVDIALDLEGTSQAIELKRLALLQARGQLSAQGIVELKPGVAWRLRSEARQFNPGALAADWPGRINFVLDTRGRLEEEGPQGTFELQSLRGRLRGRQIAGRADLSLTSQQALSGTLALQSGSSRIDVSGQGGNEMDATAVVDVRDLGDWMPDAEGNLRAQITAQGQWPKLEIRTRSSGQDLRVANARAETLSLYATVTNPKQPSGSARVELGEASAAGFEFSSLAAQAAGDQKAHTLELTASGERLGGDVRIDGSQTQGGWSGTIQQLTLDVPKIETLTLQSPARATFATGAFELEQSCLAGGEIRICAALDSRADGSLDASYSLAGVQLALVNAFVPTLPVAISGTAQGDGEIRRTAAGELHGKAQIVLPGGQISPAQAPQESLMEYSDLRLAADLAGSRARATLSSLLGDGGRLEGRVSLDGLGQASAAIDGNLSAAIPSLAPIALFVPQLAEVKGRADMRATVDGTLDAPQISGELSATELAAQVPELGLKLVEGRIHAVPDASGNVELDGEVRSGKGKLTFDGYLARNGYARVSVTGDNFLAADIPAAHVVAAPDLKFTRDTDRMSLTGEVQVPKASIDLKKLPRGSGGQRASSDVVIVDEVTRQETAEAMPLYAEVTVALGEEVKLAGFGLDATVKGRLAIQETPGVPTTGSGDIAVAGTYKAYGQDLTIRRGQLLFAGTPLDNPGLSIVAVREVEEITAGLRVEGTAKNPQLSVFSEPAMTQTEALAYLVTGRPLDAIGSQEGDGDALQSAARSLGTAGGGLLAKNVGSRLGVDEAGIKRDEMIGGAAFTVGEYLSPRLYLSYGVGLFDPGEVVSLRYKLSDEFSLQTARGPNETRAGIEYRIEK